MKSKIKRLFPFFLIGFLTFFYSCPNPVLDDTDDSGGGNGDPIDPLATYIVDDPDATILEANSEIHLTWTSIGDVEAYKIYRYSARTDALSFTDFTITDDTPQVIKELEFIDNSANVNIPYFYKIACIKSGEEHEKSDLVFGIHTNGVDEYEKNNEPAHEVASHFPTMPFIYYCPDVGDGSIGDTDWYKYEGLPQYFHVDITLNIETAFTDGNLILLFRYYYGTNNETKYEISYPIQKNGTTEYGYGNVGDYPDNPAHGDTVIVYFKVFVDQDSLHLPPANTVEDYDLDLVVGM